MLKIAIKKVVRAETTKNKYIKSCIIFVDLYQFFAIKITILCRHFKALRFKNIS